MKIFLTNKTKVDGVPNYDFYKLFYKYYVSTVSQIKKSEVLHLPSPFVDINNFEAKDRVGVLETPNLYSSVLNIFSPEIVHVLSHLSHILRPENNHEDSIVVINWIDFTGLSWESLNMLFKDFAGKILVDDTFESCPLRNNAMEQLLFDSKYNTDKVAFLTNCPRKDLTVKDGIHYRDNWLHLTLTYDSIMYKDLADGSVIQYIDDEEALLDYDRKECIMFSLNGHSTNMRMATIVSLHHAGVTSKENHFMYSLCEESRHNHIMIRFLDHIGVYEDMGMDIAEKYVNDLGIPKRLVGDVGDGRRKDFFIQKDWWANTFYNLNVDTNQQYYFDNWVNISEKWMKQILYLTPGININEYTGLEQHHKDLGFKGYDKFWDHSYDSIEDPFEKVIKVTDVIKSLKKPTIAEWSEMCDIAKYNKNYFITQHIPSLKQSLNSVFQQILAQ